VKAAGTARAWGAMRAGVRVPTMGQLRIIHRLRVPTQVKQRRAGRQFSPKASGVVWLNPGQHSAAGCASQF